MESNTEKMAFQSKENDELRDQLMKLQQNFSEALQKNVQLTEEQLDKYWHAEELEEEQGGIESSIEVNHIDDAGSGAWSEEGEEWFWVWA